MNFFFFDFVHIHCDRFNFKGLGKKRTKSTLNDFDSTLFLNYLSSPTTTFWISLSSLEIKTYLLCTKSYIQNIILTSVSSSIGAAMTLLSVLLAMCSIFSSLAYTYCFPFEYLPHISSDSIQFFMFAFFCFPTSFLLRTQNKKQFFTYHKLQCSKIVQTSWKRFLSCMTMISNFIKKLWISTTKINSYNWNSNMTCGFPTNSL